MINASETVRFQHLSTNEGLSQNAIRSIYQDSVGYIWIGTESGLNRYDGYEFRQFYHRDETINSLSDNYITSMTEDKHNILWIGTKSGGLNSLNTLTQQIISFMHVPEDNRSIQSNAIYALFFDGNSQLWIGTSRGLDILNTGTKKLTHIPISNSPDQPHIEIIVTSILSFNNELWIGTSEGLYHLDKKNKALYPVTTKLSTKLIPDMITSLASDHQGNLWIGGIVGLKLLHVNTLEVKLHKLSTSNNNNTPLRVRDLYCDTDNRIWIATTDGIYRIEKDRNKVFHYKKKQYLTDSLSDNWITKIIVDNNNILWAGTYSKGINKLPLLTQQFGLQRHLPNKKYLYDNDVVDIHSDADNHIWLLSSKLQRYNPSTNQYDEPFTKIANYNSDFFREIQSISGYDHILWGSAPDFGLFRYDIKNKSLSYYQHQDSEEYGKIPKLPFLLFNDRNKNLWLSSSDGIYFRDNITRKFSSYTPYATSKSNNYVDTINSIYLDTKNFLWVATNNGLYQIYKNNLINHHLHRQHDIKSIKSNIVYTIYETVDNNLYIGTSKGLSQYNYNTKDFTQQKLENSGNNFVIYAIQEDRLNRLWLSTNQGLVIFNSENKLSQQFVFSDGLQGNDFYTESSTFTSNGLMVFGGTGGFNIFYPNTIRQNTIIPTPQITNMQLFEKPVLMNNFITKSDISNNQKTPTIFLDHFQNNLSFTLSALDYTNPTANQYQYYLSGQQEQWMSRNAKNRKIAFTNLSPGQYRLKLKVSNNHGYWSDSQDMLHIFVRPPFWLTLLRIGAHHEHPLARIVNTYSYPS